MLWRHIRWVWLSHSCILVRCSRAKILMERWKPDMPLKHTKKIQLGIHCTQIQPKVRWYHATSGQWLEIVRYQDSGLNFWLANCKFGYSNVQNVTWKVENIALHGWAASIGKVACNVTPCVQLFVLFSCYGMQMANQVTKIFSSKGNGFLKQVSTSKSLGVDIDGNLSWECHINEISKKIAFGKSAIKRIRYFLPFEILLNVYNSLVQPHWLL